MNLLRSIERVGKVTSVPFEVILVIDGDGDRPDGEFSFPFNTITTSHVGAGPARNLGIRDAKGDGILFLNDDVVVQPGFFDAHASALNAGNDAVLGDSPWIEAEHPTAFDGFVKHTSAIFNQRSLVDGQSYDFRQGWTLNLSICRSVINQLEYPFDPEIRPIYYEDIEFVYRCFGSASRIVYCKSACVVHDHRVTLREYFAREVLLGMMSCVLFDRNRACYEELFTLSPTEHALLGSQMNRVDQRDHSRLLNRVVELSSRSADVADLIGQAALFYDLHLPIKRRAFRLGLCAMAEAPIAWNHRIFQATQILESDPVFKLIVD